MIFAIRRDIEKSMKVNESRGSYTIKPGNRLCRNVTGAGERSGQDSFAADLQKVHAAGRRLLDLIVENFASMQLSSEDAGSDVVTSKPHQAFAENRRASRTRQGM